MADVAEARSGQASGTGGAVARKTWAEDVVGWPGAFRSRSFRPRARAVHPLGLPPEEPTGVHLLPDRDMTDLDFVRVERSDGIATLTVHRPEKLNALSAAVIRELGSAFGELAADDRVAGILVTGSGDRAFVAGADISELAALTPEEALALSRRGQALFGSIEASPKPVVAAIGGVALGGGCELALACHLRVASEDALLGLPEVGLGLIPAYGGTVRLSRLIGLGRALEMILGGEPIEAETARAIGLVNAVVPRAELLEHARARLEGILRNAPIALRMALESVHHAQRAPEAEALRHESALFALLVSTEDMREGTRAFLEKRRPGFRGR